MKIFFDKDILMEIMINSIENTNDNNFKAFGALLISLPIISLMANITCDHLFVASQDERYLCWPFFICIFVFSYFCIFVFMYLCIFDEDYAGDSKIMEIGANLGRPGTLSSFDH